MGPAPRDPAAPVPGHPDRQRRGAARGDDRRARVGEPESGVVPGRVAHPAVHPPRRRPDRMRTFLLTFAVVDDLAALAIIAVFYSHHISLPALLAGLATFVVVFAVRAAGVRRGVVYLALGIVAWAAFLRSGVDPVVVGLVMGLFTQAYPAARGDLELATERFRLFREQPTPELARVASIT